MTWATPPGSVEYDFDGWYRHQRLGRDHSLRPRGPAGDGDPLHVGLCGPGDLLRHPPVLPVGPLALLPRLQPPLARPVARRVLAAIDSQRRARFARLHHRLARCRPTMPPTKN